MGKNGLEVIPIKEKIITLILNMKIENDMNILSCPYCDTPPISEFEERGNKIYCRNKEFTYVAESLKSKEEAIANWNNYIRNLIKNQEYIYHCPNCGSSPIIEELINFNNSGKDLKKIFCPQKCYYPRRQGNIDFYDFLSHTNLHLYSQWNNFVDEYIGGKFLEREDDYEMRFDLSSKRINLYFESMLIGSYKNSTQAKAGKRDHHMKK